MNDDDTRRGQHRHQAPIQTRSMYLDPQGYELTQPPPPGTPLVMLTDPAHGRWIFQVHTHPHHR